MKDPDMIMICETWLTILFNDEELYLPQYDLFRSERLPNKDGNSLHGGVLIAHKKHYTGRKITLPKKYLGACTACTFTFNSSTILQINCYFPPSESEHILSPSVITELFNIFATTKYDALIMTGDFNYSDIDWRDRSYKNESQKLLNFAEKMNLDQKVTFNTTVSGIYDLFFISRKIEVQDIRVAEEIIGVNSNHKPIWSVFTVRGHENRFKRDNSSEILSYCKADYPRMEELIIQNPFETFCWSNIAHLVEMWYKWIRGIIRETTPLRTKLRSNLPPWVTSSTSHLIKKLHTAKNRIGNQK